MPLFPLVFACTVPGFTDAVFGDKGVSFTGNGCTDASVGTNAIASGAITLTGNACVKGTCDIGAGGKIASISGAAGCNATGVEPAAVTLAPVTIPSYPNASPLSPSAPATLAPNLAYGAISAAGGSGNVLTLNAGSYVMSSLALSGQASLKVASGPVVVYVSGSGAALDLSGNGVDNGTGVPGNLVFLCADTVTSVSVTGNATANFAVYCPKADIAVHGNGDIFGAVVGKTVTDTGNGTIRYDKALGGFTNGQLSCTSGEVSRASPVVATVSNQAAVVQGTFLANAGTKTAITTHASVAIWTFPYVTGHMRARTAASIATTATAYASGTILFDAATAIPPRSNGCAPPLDGSCRYVFTNISGAAVALNDTNASTIGTLIAPGLPAADYTTISHAILGGALGGVDRSTVAVIEPSAFAGSGARPQIAYFGGLDGMLHAVCASSGGACSTLGAELWAFVPRVELSLIRTNDQRLDGSPHVIDVFGDFTGTGARTWRTILVVQAGGAAGVYALDVTDPASPRLLWEYVPPGNGLAVSSGPVAPQANLAFVETNNGSGAAGVVTSALALETGTLAWQFTHAYPAAAAVPATGLPGGAVAVDLVGQKLVTDVVFGDLYGELWRLDAATGTNKTGSTPLFSFTYAAASDKHPIGALPAIYSDGNTQYAAFTSGGYADPSDSSWQLGTQYLAAIKLKAAAPPVHETSTVCTSCDLRVLQPLASGDRGYSQALVVGNQLFVTTDASDVNASTYGTTGAATGHAIAVSGLNNTAAVATTIIYAGGSALANSGTTLYSSSSDKQVALGTPTTGGAGPSVGFLGGALAAARLLWLRLQ